MAELTDEGRDAIRKSNRDRGHKCGQCHSLSLTVRDGAEIGGMPGLSYQWCGGCGWSRAITERPRREKLR